MNYKNYYFCTVAVALRSCACHGCMECSFLCYWTWLVLQFVRCKRCPGRRNMEFWSRKFQSHQV